MHAFLQLVGRKSCLSSLTRGVCYLLPLHVPTTDVLQGVVLLMGSIIFLVIQRTELGGLPQAAVYYRDPAHAAAPNVALMQNIPPASTIVAYFDFVFKVRQAVWWDTAVRMYRMEPGRIQHSRLKGAMLCELC